MRRSMEYNRYQRVIYTFMAFAFFWLVMGDLITLHQKLIYGFDPFGQHQPFTKPNHSGNKSGKNEKAVKAKDNSHFCAFTGITNHVKIQPVFVDFIFGETLIVYNLVSTFSSISLRAPPSTI
ncbi:MAG: hypothetical protein GXO86_01185 [Chlorobi bacterium]|nr:hypothetical protein [Chlorobiota bacterium]